ncbi:hypothetical protein RB601_009767 [Gaeumannomyces tritici]
MAGSETATTTTTAVAGETKPSPPTKNASPPKPNPQGGSLSLEPNPFEQSFGGAPPETPGGTKLLPPVAALTSPSSLLPGSGATPFNWGGGSLRTGPLSPAMLSGPANDYFSDAHHLRGGFPTPNESSLRTGLTPGGSGSMFPAPSPNSSALFASITSGGGATPSTLDFHRTALSAAAAKREPLPQPQAQTQGPAPPPQPQAQAPPPPPPPQPQAPQQQQTVTSQPQNIEQGSSVKPDAKPSSGPFDPHDNDAANGLYLLAHGRNGAPAQNNFLVQPPQQPVHAHPPPLVTTQSSANTSPQMRTVNGNAARQRAVGSEGASAASDDSEQARPSTRGGKGKKTNGITAPAATNGRRKAVEEAPAKPPATKKTKMNASPPQQSPIEEDFSDDDDDMKMDKDGNTKSKMTDEEKRKNFLERNRVAALKCRQRKKQWLANLQSKVEIYSQENDQLTQQIAQLREEVVNLKTLLLAHKDCPVTQQQGLHGAFMQQQAAMEPFNAQMNPYGMAASIPNQPVMAAGQRRFS